NATAPNSSLALAAKVFKTGLLSEPGAADIGWASVPLGEVPVGYLVAEPGGVLDRGRILAACRAELSGLKVPAELSVPVVHRSDALASLMGGLRALAVAGTHGKTTTTSML
ncbi:hypothetical protein PUR30_00045, partial [Streptomyces sp. JV190]|nr:hypothetical protein [Streptomyces sp. JV190]